MAEREKLWNAVEAAEKRRDAQLAREIEISLPRELTPEQRVALVVQFIHDEFVQRGMTADIALHTGVASDKGEQPHAHVLLTLRSVTSEGFGAKNTNWNDRALLQSWRERWAAYANDALAKAGHVERIDHRSHEARGIDRQPQVKLGPAAHRVRRQATGGKPVPATYRRRLERAAGVWMDGQARSIGERYSAPQIVPAEALHRLAPVQPSANPTSASRIAQMMVLRARRPVARSAVRLARSMKGQITHLTRELVRDDE
jgi:ATP-dependent exoDNAse (exonuclease V) alpha subunit